MNPDLEISRSVCMKPIVEIAGSLGLKEEDIELYGKYKAKISLQALNYSAKPEGKLILVTAVSPTPAGEGKTTVSIGLAQALQRIGQKAVVVLREPSMGPVFGMKGGATGGGYSQVLPVEDINLHFTGDFSAVEKAHNLLSALIDNNLQSKSRSLGIDPRTIVWKRVFDLNDRSLRQIVIGMGGTASGIPRETGFDITAASEVMAILCLSTDIRDLKKRLGNIFIGYTYQKKPVFARDLNAQGAMAALLKEAIKPNLVQTLEGTPALIHGGPFANIAQGTNSILATRMGLQCADFTVTEAGFGSDLGAEKFIDIKCRQAGFIPQVAVIAVTARAMRYHGGLSVAAAQSPDKEALKRGLPNLGKHIENVRKLGMVPVVAINHFVTDTAEEMEEIAEYCGRMQVKAFVVKVWAEGGAGAEELARYLVKFSEHAEPALRPLYETTLSPDKKIERIATEIYGASGVQYSREATKKLKEIENLGLSELLVCIAKTQKSLSDNPDLRGRPGSFTLQIRDIEIASGAGFIIPIAGDILRMPGLPEIPSSEHLDLDQEGNITGLF